MSGRDTFLDLYFDNKLIGIADKNADSIPQKIDGTMAINLHMNSSFRRSKRPGNTTTQNVKIIGVHTLIKTRLDKLNLNEASPTTKLEIHTIINHIAQIIRC